MEEKKDQDSPSASRENSKLDMTGERSSLTISSSLISIEDESPLTDSQMRVDEPEEGMLKMEIGSSELLAPSEVLEDQLLGLTAGSKIEQRKAGAPEYFETCDIPVYHKVEFAVGLSFAMINKSFASSQHSLDKSRKAEVPVALGSYHIEFRLLPTDEEPTQIDIVQYSYFARVFIEKNESKTVRYYHDGRLDWVTWNQIFEVDITNDLLLQLFDYTLDVNVWDSKEKLMSRTRFDKPRWMKFESDEGGDGGKQVNFQKEWLNQVERNTFTPEMDTPTDTRKSSKLNIESSLNITSNESEVHLEGVKRQLSSITLSKTDVHRKVTSPPKDVPVTKVSINLRYFFSDMCSVTKQLEKPIEGLVDLLASVTLNRSLLSEQQKRNLNPMVITVHSVKDMPGSSEEIGSDYSQLKAKCHPVYLKYKFIRNNLYESAGKHHQKDINFNDINVILTGNIEAMELREFFQGPGLVIEIHDRDRKPSKTDHQPLLYGDDLNDEKFSNIGVITSRKTKINPYKSPPADSLDSFGVARFDLSGFTLGQKFCYQELSIINSHTLDSLQNVEAENVNFMKKINPDSNKENGPFMPGQYVHSCSMINVTIKLNYPIIIPPVTNPRPPISPTYNCPFGRMVFRIASERQEFLEDVLLTIAQINGRALGLNDVPDNILIATLLTFITTRHQRFDRMLDIITGFHIIDENMHVLVVEGLQNYGTQTLVSRFGDTDLPDVKILFNTDLICSDRLYATFDVVLRKVKLHESLESIVQQPLIYIRDMVPRPCYDALIQIHELSKCSRLIDAIRNNLFPTANMVRSLSKEFGVVIKEEHVKIDASVACQEDYKQQVLPPDTPSEEGVDHRNIKWKYIDHYNKSYVQLLKRNLHSAPANFIARNVNLVTNASEKMKMKKVPENTVNLPLPLKDVHNYGMSTYNTTELKKLELRRQMDPKSMYTYCPDFHHSMTFAPIELEHLYKKEEIRKKKKWRTPGGWVFPGFKSAVDAYVHPKKPSSARIKELSQPYEETLGFEKRDPRERCAFTWSQRDLDMNIWNQPTTDPCEKVHVLGNQGEQAAIIKENNQKEAENLQSKMVVKNTRTRFHRQLTETEVQVQGRRASCQLDRMKGLLKDKPMRRAFKYRPVADISSLSVVSYPELGVNSADRKLLKSYDGNDQKRAYVPGPYWPERSLALFGNHTRMYDYEHTKFATFKGDDFKSLHTPHDSIYKRKHPVTPVSEEEKRTDYWNLKNCFCRSHTVPEVWRRHIFHCSGPPDTADANMETTNYNNSQSTGSKNMTGSKPASPIQMDH